MQNHSDWPRQPGSQIPYQPYPDDPPPSYDIAVGQASPETAAPDQYGKDFAPTSPPITLPHVYSSGHVYGFPNTNVVSATYPTQPLAPHLASVNYPRQPPGTQQVSMVGSPMPPPDGPLVQNQPKSSATRTCTGVSAGLIVLFILIMIIFKFFIEVV